MFAHLTKMSNDYDIFAQSPHFYAQYDKSLAYIYDENGNCLHVCGGNVDLQEDEARTIIFTAERYIRHCPTLALDLQSLVITVFCRSLPASFLARWEGKATYMSRAVARGRRNQTAYFNARSLTCAQNARLFDLRFGALAKGPKHP
jgi:hypothetical protein